MLARFRRRLTFANVTSAIALFVALGGGAYAAVQIDGAQLKNRSVSGRKLKRDTITGKEIKESKLGRVPLAALAGRAATAEKLAGLGPGNFARGPVTLTARRMFALPGSGDHTIVSLPGLADVIGNCAGTITMRAQDNIPASASVNNVTAVMSDDSAQATWKQLAPGESLESSGTLTIPHAKTITWDLGVVNSAPAATVFGSVIHYVNDACEFSATAVRYSSNPLT